MSEEYTTRVNIRVPKEVYAWFKTKSDRTGVAMSALMYLALEQHILQSNTFTALDELNKKLEEVKGGKASDNVPR